MSNPVSRRRSFALLVAWIALVPAAGSSAQTPTEAELSGSVRTALGEPVQRPVITLLDLDGETVRSFTGGLDGNFTLRGVGLGTYWVRVEALGFRPQVLRTVTLRPGSTARLDIVLRSGAGGVDTVATSAGGSGSASGRWIGRDDLRDVPTELPSLDEWVTLSTVAAPGFGLTGLPGAFTAFSIDGLAFRPVRPLGLRTIEHGLGLVAARSVAAAEVVAAPGGLASPSGAGGRIAVHSLRGTQTLSGADAAGSGDPLRVGSGDPDDAPSTVSVWAGGGVTLSPSPDTTTIVLAVDAWQRERPQAGLLGTGGEVEGVDASYVEQRRGLSAFARFDHALGADGSLWGTGRLSIQPAANDLTAMAWGLADTGERVDLLVGGGFLTSLGPRELLEVRVGVGRSAWSSAATAEAELPFDAGSPTFLDASTGLRGGPGFVEAESATRVDGDLAAAAVIERGRHRLHVGVRGGAGFHTQDFGRDPWIRTYVGAGAPDGSWQGAFSARRYRGEQTATVPRFGVFAEDRWDTGGGLELRFGGGFDSEWLPIRDLVPNDLWYAASGLTAPTLAEQVTGGSGFVGLSWQGATGTALTLDAAYQSHPFDVNLLFETLNSVDYDVISGSSPERAWPEPPTSAVSPNRVVPSYASLVADPEAPASVRLSGQVSHTSGALDLSLGGLLRHTNGLTRRRNLNRPASPHGTDQNGRALWAQPLKVGTWLGADPSTSRRFDAFGPVWELDQGGWSEYLGVTVSAGYRLPGGLRIDGAYTWSRTEDNVPGLADQGFLTGIALEAVPGEEATEGRSDLDRPHRLTGILTIPLPVGVDSRLSGTYRYVSGAPFTPGYAPGVDANLDGLSGNAAAFVSDAAAAAHPDWDCLDDDRGAFATRNGCREDPLQMLDLRLEVGIPGPGIRFFVDAFNVLDSSHPVVDTALLGVRGEAGLDGVGSGTVLPFETNDEFGSTLRDRSGGRWLRFGLRVVR